MGKHSFELEKENYERLKLKLSRLIFIDGIAIYHDPLQETAKKYALVTTEGRFLFEKIKGYPGVFVDRIKINGYGLFELPMLYGNYIMDKEANYQSMDRFDTFKKILKNRKGLYTPETYYMPDKELVESKFQYCKGAGYGWTEKNGDKYLEFGEKENGLIFRTTVVRSGRDSETDREEVFDCEGNNMFLADFWQFYIMLESGKRYLERLNEYILLISS